MRLSRAHALALFAVALGCPSRASAINAEVRAETQAQSYQLRGPLGATVLSFRRVTQTLSLGAQERSAHPSGWIFSLRARLRIDSDFGSSCDPGTDRCLDEVNRSRAVDFAPLFARRSLDLPWAYADLERLAGGHLDLRAGRQWIFDPVGMLLFDGARARVHMGDHVSVDLFGGWETRAGFPLSNGRYARDGLQYADRSAWDVTVAPQVSDRASAWLVGATVDLHGAGPVEARWTYRRTTSASGVAEEKAGAIVDVSLGRGVHMMTEGVVSIPEERVTWASFAIERVRSNRDTIGIELSRSRPSFDLTSIWASFWIDPTDDLRLHAERVVGRGWTVMASLLGRRYALDAATIAANANRLGADEAQYAGGATLSLNLRRGRGDAWARTTFEHGSVATRTGADLGGRWWLRPGRIRGELGASLWWAEDAFRPDRSTTSVGIVAAVLFRLGSVADFSLALEDDMNRVVCHRVRATGVIALRGPF